MLKFDNVVVRGIAACVPGHIRENRALSILGEDGADNFIKSVGVERVRTASSSECSSDLCAAAAERLIAGLGWNKDEIGVCVFVTQTPDYVLPATSCLLQNKLGLSQKCICLDISLGCSGWVYAMSTAAAYVSAGKKRALVLAGDTITKLCSSKDKSTFPLFGDAGTATALEYSSDYTSSGMTFELAVDGSGSDVIIVPDGGFRNVVSESSFVEKEKAEGIRLNNLQLHLEGMDVFTFGISKAPSIVSLLLDETGMDKDSVDFYVFHQANLFMNEKIRKKLRLPCDKVPYSLKNFGNTSCASIPLTMVTEMRDELSDRQLSIVACGFGVGLSWGACHFTTDKIVCPELVEYKG